MCPDGANKRETRWLWVRSQLAWEVSLPFVTSQGVDYMLLHVLAQALWLVDWAKQQTHIVREHYKRCFERNINMYFGSPAGNFLNLPTDNKKDAMYLSEIFTSVVQVFIMQAAKNTQKLKDQRRRPFASFESQNLNNYYSVSRNKDIQQAV